MSLEDAVTYEFTWHTVQDDKVCLQCARLSEETWIWPKLSGVLEHSDFGAVYDLDADLPLTHPNCRCILEVNPIIDLEKMDVYRTAQEILEKSDLGLPSNIDDATRKLESLRAEAGHTHGVMRELEYIFYRTTSMMHKAGLPEEFNQALMFIQRMILTVRVLHTTITLLEMSTPYGWTLAIISGLAAAATASDLALSLGE